jgi:hypothetical protein
MTNKKPLQQQVCHEFSSSVETKADHNDSGNGSGRSVPHTLKEAVHEAGSQSVASRWQQPQCVLVLTCMVYADRTEYVRLRLPMQACIKLMYLKEVSFAFLAKPPNGFSTKPGQTSYRHWSILFPCRHVEV